MNNSLTPNGPLAGLRIVELSNVIAGPTAGQILGDFGADVIKVEHPDGGDASRRQGRTKDGVPLWWKMLGRNKRSVGMYLGDPEVAELFLELVKGADVVVESFRPGTLEKWGLGYERLASVNPRVILARLTGFGQTGPYSHKPAFGTNIEAMTGFASLTGEADRPPMLPVFALADFVAGYSLVAAILMALYHRDVNGGSGQVIDASLFRPLMATLSRQIIDFDQTGIVATRSGNLSPSSAPRNAYLTKDEKWVCVSAATPKLAARVMRLVGRPDFADNDWFSTAAGRVQHVDELDRAVSEWVTARTRDEVLAEAEIGEATFAPIYDVAEMMSDVHVRANNMIAEVEDPDLGSIRMPGLLFGLSDTPGRIRWTGPGLGASTKSVLINELGSDPTVIQSLLDRGVVR